MVLSVVLSLLMACATSPSPAGRAGPEENDDPVDSDGVSDTADSPSPTTGPTTDTDDSGEPAYPPYEGQPPASVVVYGTRFRGHDLIPHDDTTLLELLVDDRYLLIDAATLPPSGLVHYDDLWDGVSEVEWGEVTHLRDMDGDGHDDYFIGRSIRPGPLLGRYTPWATPADAIAYLLVDPADALKWPHLVLDADQDGHEDLLVTGTGYDAVPRIYFGPFDGPIPDPAADDSTVLPLITRKGIDAYTLTLAPDLLGLGEDALLMAHWENYLQWDTMTPLPIARGGIVEHSDFLQGGTWYPVSPLGDLNGDGINDVVADHGVYFGPILGPESFDPARKLTSAGSIGPGGDLNGDGMSDLLMRVDYERYVLLSPHRWPLTIDQGVPIEPDGGVVIGDVDGDGRDDVVINTSASKHESVLIYLGVDLEAADPG